MGRGQAFNECIHNQLLSLVLVTLRAALFQVSVSIFMFYLLDDLPEQTTPLTDLKCEPRNLRSEPVSYVCILQSWSN